MKPLLTAVIICGWFYPCLAQSTTGHSGTGDNIDVKYHRFEWTINPDNSFYISGKVTTYFVTGKNNVSQITFDFTKNSYDNSDLKVYYHGELAATSFPTSGNRDILQISLPVTLSDKVLDSVTIYYAGTPPTPPVGQPGGCFQKTIAGYPLFYSLSESYEDKDWWPCKADMRDKIDSTDFIITTPSDYTVAANGKLISETISGGNKISLFKHRYPIASYQVGIAVSEYDIYNRGTVNIGGAEMPVVYYISKGRTPTTTQLNQFDVCKQELQVFSNLFGDYPFKNEKYGMYEFGFNGGMEHNTFSGMSWGAFLRPDIVAHELMHQWFGDKVTMATWNHLWLSEGFASYGEILAAEKISSLGLNPSSLRGNLKNSANSNAQKNYPCYIPEANIVNSVALWGSQYGNTVYTRGGIVVSMLRTLMGDDKFFQACRDYLDDPQLAYGSATTADLQAHLEAVLGGFDLSGFFNSFVYGNGYPDYGKNSGNSIKWQSIGAGNIRFRVDAPAKSAGSDVANYFSVIPLLVKGPDNQQKLVVLYDKGGAGIAVGGNGITTGNSPTAEVNVGFTPVSVEFDPFNMSLAIGAAVEATVLPVAISSFNVIQNNYQNIATIQLTENQHPSSVVLEKSADGAHFSPIGNMDNLQNGKYIFHDTQSSDTDFYRVKITEPTGEIIYSEIVKVRGKVTTTFSLISNPAQELIKVKVPFDVKNESLHISIFDMSGRAVFRAVKTALNGMVELDTGSVQNGAYFLHIESFGKAETLKVFVNK